jgi:hypothetical protein
VAGGAATPGVSSGPVFGARRRRPRAGGTTKARTAFQCRVADLVDATAPELNAAGVLQPVDSEDDSREEMSRRQAIPVIPEGES